MAANPLIAVAGIALAQIGYEWRTLVTISVAIAAVIAPILLFFAIRAGYVEELGSRLTDNPEIREIRLDGQMRFDAAWFRNLAAREDVAFVVPRTRHLNVGLRVRNPANRKIPITEAELVPSAAGDPLLPSKVANAVTGEAVALSRRLADALEIEDGDEITALVTRTHDNRPEMLRRTLSVVSTLPSEVHARDAIFADPALMLAIERYREGAEYDIAALRNEETVASFRLYAADLDAVAPLAAEFTAKGLRVVTEARRISDARESVSALNAVVAVLVGIVLIGGIMSVAGSLASSVLSLTGEISTLRMLGYTAPQLLIFPITLALAAALFGSVLGLGAYALAETMISERLVEELPISHSALALTPGAAASTLLLAASAVLAASALATAYVLRIDATTRLRDG